MKGEAEADPQSEELRDVAEFLNKYLSVNLPWERGSETYMWHYSFTDFISLLIIDIPISG